MYLREQEISAAQTAQNAFSRRRLRSTIGAGMLMMGASITIGTGFLIAPGAEFFDVTNSQFLIWFSLFSFFSAMGMTLVGRLSAKIGIRIIVVASSSIAMFAALGMAMATSLNWFFVFAALLGVGWSGSTFLAANITVNGWWVAHHRGGAVLGLVMGASGVGGSLWGLLFPFVVETAGLQGGLLTISFLVALFMLIPGIFLIRNPPNLSSAHAEQNNNKAPRPAVTRKYKWVFASLVLIGFGISLESPLSQVLPAVFESIDIPTQLSGLLVAGWSITNTLMMPFIGWFYDRFGLRNTLIFVGTTFGLGFAGLAIAESFAAVLFMLPLLSIALSAMTIVLPLVVTRSVGETKFPAIYGVVTTALFVGLATGTPFWGLSYDLTGSYAPALLIGAVLGVICIAAMGLTVRWANTGGSLYQEEKRADASIHCEGPGTQAATNAAPRH